MAFVRAMDSRQGANVYTDTGDARVNLFTMLNRGLEISYIQRCVKEIIEQYSLNKTQDLFVMAFQTRDIRGGKGERKLFYQMLHVLHHFHPNTTRRMLKLIPEYGCWRDMWELWTVIPELRRDILTLVKTQFITDLVYAGTGETNSMSLLAKWLPREKSATYPRIAAALADFIYASEPSVRKRIIRYRKETSFMNAALKTVEIDMCGGTWRTISFAGVPGRCMKLHDNAFLNVKSGELRYPNRADRMMCREKFLAFMEDVTSGEKTIRGAHVVLPHELILKAQNPATTREQHVVNQAQWESIRDETRKLGGLGKVAVMCDFSGSMSGIPLQISLALGILISECTHPAFRDHILTFDSTPRWHSFVGHSTLKSKLDSLLSCGQGLNTDFYRACQMILARMIQWCVPVDEAPEDLIVITDMGFDAASNSANQSSSSRQSPWETQLTRIRREFQEAGEHLWGKAWKAPRIVIWNVRAEFKDFHAKADQEGVVQLSGWSPSMLKVLQKGVQVQTPYQGMRSVLDDARYDAVRAIWEDSMRA